MHRKTGHFFNKIRRQLTPRHLWSELRFSWMSGDRGNILFASSFISIITALGIFISHTITAHKHARELNCLALNIYHEARGEPDEGKYAVASVTLNRVESKHYPDTICKVVYQKRWDYLRNRYVGAFSWTELDNPVSTNNKAWVKAASVAKDIYYNPESNRLEQALFYHARHIRPSWARKKVSVAQIGRHIFYN